jgi:hypothetical protein
MPAVFQSWVSGVKERTASRVTVPVLSAAEQTRLSWARLVRSLDDLPAAYRNFFETLPVGAAFPYAVLTPTFAGFMRRETEKLVCCIDECLYVLEKTPGALKHTCFALTDLNYVEVGGVLLNAWITFQGIANEGGLTTIMLRFNAVTDRLFTPFADQFRGAGVGSIDFQREAELRKLDNMDLLSFKFRNYARHSLLPGAQIVAAVAQPEVRRTVVQVGRWSYNRTIIMAHVLILTDRELIIISDDPNSPKAVDDTRYGGVWTYIPLSRIERIACRDRDAAVLAVVLELPHGDQIESLFAADRRGEVEQFLDQVGDRMGA